MKTCLQESAKKQDSSSFYHWKFPVFDKRVAEIGSRLWETLSNDNEDEPLMITDEIYNTLPALDEYTADSTEAPYTDMIPRRKRYTEYQENSLAMCAGECMYMRRSFYGECYELCNWNGLTSSPWKKLDKQSQQQQPNVSRVPTHRFGPLTNHHSSSLKSTWSPSAVHQGSGGKIKIVAGRPLKPRRTSLNEIQKTSSSSSNNNTNNSNSKQSKVASKQAAVKGKGSKIRKCSS